jgi:hypothetical protein
MMENEINQIIGKALVEKERLERITLLLGTIAAYRDGEHQELLELLAMELQDLLEVKELDEVVTYRNILTFLMGEIGGNDFSIEELKHEIEFGLAKYPQE